ncbi:MAG TPA: dephospho-CoA kinase [Rhodanobacteraceae bacterium]|nr:dephospho-CoA kinase [Rhodanobacteraceae bacterium]
MTDTPRHTSWVVALTGGIAAGKSAVSRRFEALGIRVQDADVAAREVVAPGTSGLAAIVEAFGHDILQADGSLNRRALREHVFADKEGRRRLEAIVHPRVNAWLRERGRNDKGPYGLLAIPLLAETWPQYEWVDRILLVEASTEVRIARLMQRDRIDEASARRMLDAQASDEARRALADDVIDNNGDLDALNVAVEKLHRHYLELAAASSKTPRL